MLIRPINLVSGYPVGRENPNRAWIGFNGSTPGALHRARLGPLRLAFGGGEFTTGLARGASLSARGYFEAQTKRDDFVLTMSAFLAEWDAWICPVAPTVAFTHRRTGAPIGCRRGA